MREILLCFCALTLFYSYLFSNYIAKVQSYHMHHDQTRAELGKKSIESVKFIRCRSTKGDFDVLLNHKESPNGVTELVNMVRAGFFNSLAFFRVNHYIVQFGVREKTFKYRSDWERDLNQIPRDERQPWKRGVMAMIGGTQMIIVKNPNQYMGLNNHDTVVGTISEDDMPVIDNLYAYNDVIDNPKGAHGPSQVEIYEKGWPYLNQNFPLVDQITGCDLVS